jgi:hypothetical protein
MSDQSEVTGTVTRRPRKKAAGGATAPKARKVKITFQFASKSRPRSKGGRKARTWDNDWPEFLERLKALMKRYKITIRKTSGGKYGRAGRRASWRSVPPAAGGDS